VLNDARAGTPLLAGPLVRLACQRHLTDRLTEGPATEFYFDDTRADHAIAFFETVLRLPDTQDADGNPRAFLLAPYQDFIVGSLFGWLKRSTNTRRFQDAYVEIGKGNGKTPLAAAIGLYLLVLDGELAAEIYSAATTKDQAKILFADAERMVATSPELQAAVNSNLNNLANKETHSFFRPVSSEHRGLDGKRPHGVLIDELHEHPTPQVANKMRAGRKGRRQPLIFEITNSGYDRTSVCWEHHEHSRRVVEGLVDDDQWFAYVCALDDGDDPIADDRCWLKANPNLGVSIQYEYLRRQVDSAKHIPAELNTVLRLNFCVWTNAAVRFFDRAKWLECPAEVPDVELEGHPCYAAFDLGQSDDFAALSLIWDLPDGRVGWRGWFWLPESAIEKYKNRPYDQWRRAGALTVTDGDTTDYDEVEDTIRTVCERWGVREVGYDKRFAEQMAQHLVGHGLQMVDTPQGFYLNAAIKRTNELVINGELCHGNHPILGWMADNAVVRHGRDKELRLDKERARDKIDGVAALVMAVDRWIKQSGPSGSVYEERGLMVL
jgi:phage terminase large subunit-like protein